MTTPGPAIITLRVRFDEAVILGQLLAAHLRVKPAPGPLRLGTLRRVCDVLAGAGGRGLVAHNGIPQNGP